MQPRSATHSSPASLLHEFLALIPPTVQKVLFAAVKVALILLAAQLLVRFVPVFERLVVRRASLGGAARATDSVLDQRQRVETLVRVVSSVTRTVIGSLAIVMSLGAIGIDIAPLIAGAGIAGVAIGFGAQSIVKDYFNGFFILLESQFAVGDHVVINTVEGVVEEMSMRLTVLRDPSGNVHFFQNGNISTVSNKTYGWLRAVITLAAPSYIPTHGVRAILEDVAKDTNEDPALKEASLGPVEVIGPLEFTGATVTWRLQVKARPREVHEVRMKLIAEIQERLAVDPKSKELDWLAAWEKVKPRLTPPALNDVAPRGGP